MNKPLALVSILVGLGAFACPSPAFEPKLTATERAAAVAAGKSLASLHAGYSLGDYAIYAVPDALSIRPKQGMVDAIVLATPFERLRKASYIAFFQGTSPSARELADAARPYTLDFVVFAHSMSPTKSEQGFLSRFGAPQLTTRAGETLRSAASSNFGPVLDFYNVIGKGREPRWVGYVSFRFDLDALTAHGTNLSHLSGTFSLTDPSGRRYSPSFDLSKYR